MASERSKFQKPFTVIEQWQSLNKMFPALCWKVDRGVLSGKGVLQPTPMSCRYGFCLDYRVFGRDKYSLNVYVFGDNLHNLEDPKFPHRYEIDKERKRVRICLYRFKEFSSRRLIAETIIPWAIEWLLFYEGWLITGEWIGGGEHPPKKKVR